MRLRAPPIVTATLWMVVAVPAVSPAVVLSIHHSRMAARLRRWWLARGLRRERRGMLAVHERIVQAVNQIALPMALKDS